MRERFNADVLKGDGCWIWQGTKMLNGYGRFGRTVYAHRASWEFENGPIPKGLQVNHHCDERMCVRPDHLYAGTHRDNMDDMMARRRGWWQRRSHGV